MEKNKNIIDYYEYHNKKIHVYSLSNKHYICHVDLDYEYKQQKSIIKFISHRLPLFSSDNNMILFSQKIWGIKFKKYVN